MFEGEVKESQTDMEQRDVEMNLQEEVKLAFSVVGWGGDGGGTMHGISLETSSTFFCLFQISVQS